MRRLRVAHVITGLGTGGAESMLVQLVARMDRERFSNSVVSLLREGPNTEHLRALGVPVASLEMNPRYPDPSAVLRLARWLRRSRADVVQTWLYHGDLIGGLAARLAGIERVVWGLHTHRPPEGAKAGTRATVALCRRLAHEVPMRIVSCSSSGIEEHVALGYPAQKMVLIENGFDVERFQPRPAARASFRSSFAIDDDTPLVGLSARVVPEKDHYGFLTAIRTLLDRGHQVRFVLCGEGTADNPVLMSWIEELGLQRAAVLLGRRDDMEQLLPALDVACSSSRVEALSMALGEALAAGVPCAATDVGDTAALVNGGGFVVPPGEPSALADAIAALLEEGPERRARRGLVGRAHVAARYSLEACARRYEALYERLCEGVG